MACLLSLTIVSLLLITASSAAPQDLKTNFGNDFYTGFSESFSPTDLSRLFIYVITEESTPVQVSLYNSSDAVIKTLTVQSNEPASKFDLNGGELTVQNSTNLYKGLRVKAEGDKKIAVFASNTGFNTAAMFMVLPSYTYPGVQQYEYVALSSVGQKNSTVLLVAGEDNTTVTVQPRVAIELPSAVTNGDDDMIVSPGQSYTFMLQRMQSLLIESSEDLTSTKFTSDKPLSVISGHTCAQVPVNEGVCDQILEQIPPSLTWGRVFMSVPFMNRMRGAYYRMVTAQDSTSITIKCGENSTTLFAVHSGDALSYHAPVNTSCSFVADRPILLGQYSATKIDSLNVENFGTPLLMSVPPTEQYVVTDRVTIPHPQTNSVGHTSVNIITSSTCVDNIGTISVGGVKTTINWQPIQASNGLVLGYGAALPLPDSDSVDIVLPSSIPITIFTYGFSITESYGSLVSTALQQTSNSSFIVPGFSQSRYTFSETDKAAFVTLERAFSAVPLEVSFRSCNSSLSDTFRVDPVTFSAGESSKVVSLSITDDNEIRGTVCSCLEVVASCYGAYSQLSSMTQTTVCVEDDDGIRVTLSSASVMVDQLELIVDVEEFRGDVPVTIQLYPVVRTTNSDDDSSSTSRRRQTDTQEVTMELAPLTLCITKDLSQAVLRRPLNETEQTTTISSIGLRLNSSMNVTFPPNNTITLSTPTPSQTPPTLPTSIVNGALILYIVIGALTLIVIVLLLIICVILACYCRTCRSSSADLEKVVPTSSSPTGSNYAYSSQQMLYRKSDYYRSSQSLQSSYTDGSVRNIAKSSQV